MDFSQRIRYSLSQLVRTTFLSLPTPLFRALGMFSLPRFLRHSARGRRAIKGPPIGPDLRPAAAQQRRHHRRHQRRHRRRHRQTSARGRNDDASPGADTAIRHPRRRPYRPASHCACVNRRTSDFQTMPMFSALMRTVHKTYRVIIIK